MCSSSTPWSATDGRQSLSHCEARKLGVMIENCTFRNSYEKPRRDSSENSENTNTSVRHGVKDDVDAERVSAFFGEFAEEIGVFLLAFPAIAVVGIMAGDNHDVPFVIEDRADVDLPAFFALVCFPGDPGVLAALAKEKIWHL